MVADSTQRQSGVGVFRLVGEHGGRRLCFRLETGENRVGSRADCAVVIPGRQVSRQHAMVVVDDDGVRVEDAGSKNGTHVNGVRVTRARLELGDWVQVGEVVLTLEAVPHEEDELAVVIEVKAQPLAMAPQPDLSTELGRNQRPRPSWADALNRFSAELLAGVAPAPTSALAVLAEGLGLEFLTLLRRDLRTEPVALFVHGDLDSGLALTEVEGLVAIVLRQRSAGIGSASLGEERPCMAALELQADGWRYALLTSGQGAAPELAPVLETALRMVLHRGGIDAPQATAEAREPSDLVFPPGHVVGRSAAMTAVYEQLRAVVRGSVPVLVVGETGVGKEHAARILHSSSDRAGGPFVAVNCAAIPAELLEAELFGIESGVATGVSGRPGKLRLAHHGLLLLDEVADMPPTLQVKLLRALQEREVHPVGARAPIPVDVRVVAATSVQLEQRVAAGLFRRELYYRIAGATVRMPPLRERREDVPALVESFLRRSCEETGRVVRGISVGALAALQRAPWPGNVRQLEHEVGRLVLACPEGQAIESHLLAPETINLTHGDPTPGPDDLTLGPAIEQLERRLIASAVARARGNLAAAARLLGVTRNGLVLKLQRLGLDR